MYICVLKSLPCKRGDFFGFSSRVGEHIEYNNLSVPRSCMYVVSVLVLKAQSHGFNVETLCMSRDLQDMIGRNDKNHKT